MYTQMTRTMATCIWASWTIPGYLRMPFLCISGGLREGGREAGEGGEGGKEREEVRRGRKED